MRRAIGENRPRDLAYAMFWVGIHDAEDVIHDAYEIALRRGERPTSLRLAIRQCVGRFVAARARGWAALGDAVDQVASDEPTFEARLDLRRGLERCNAVDVAELVAAVGGARAPSRDLGRRLRLARRRVSNCLRPETS
jgi:hypothetical protein